MGIAPGDKVRIGKRADTYVVSSVFYERKRIIVLNKNGNRMQASLYSVTEHFPQSNCGENELAK